MSKINIARIAIVTILTTNGLIHEDLQAETLDKIGEAMDAVQARAIGGDPSASDAARREFNDCVQFYTPVDVGISTDVQAQLEAAVGALELAAIEEASSVPAETESQATEGGTDANGSPVEAVVNAEYKDPSTPDSAYAAVDGETTNEA